MDSTLPKVEKFTAKAKTERGVRTFIIHPRRPSLDNRKGETRYTGIYPVGYMDDPTTAGVTEGFGLMFYNARWLRSVPEAQRKGYDPGLGRFAQADTIIPLQTQGVQAWDRYAGMNNNPIRYSDPSGHRPDDGCRNEGCSLTQYQKNRDAQKVALLEAESRYRKCRDGSASHCVQVDEWAWDNIPSTLVFHRGISGQLGFGGEVGLYREIAYAFNWRSLEFNKLYVSGRYMYIGTPQLAGGGVYKGVSVVYGASSISNLQGDSNAAGFSGSLALDADGVQIVDGGSSRPIIAHQVNIGIGTNILVDAPGGGGVLANENVITGAPSSAIESVFYYLLYFFP